MFRTEIKVDDELTEVYEGKSLIRAVHIIKYFIERTIEGRVIKNTMDHKFEITIRNFKQGED
jgi:hypothetical protein|tara:strand:- start:192 stop:377 length:186 start_codon:yes stop_codon:yes gene_type:complete